MSDGALDFGARLIELRSAFDRTFAEPPPVAESARVRLLAIRIGDHGCAVRLEQVSGLEKSRRLVSLPGTPAAFVGLMGLRGVLLPIFSLARLFGEEPSAAEPWVLVCGERDPIGLAVASFDGHVEVAPADVVPVPAPVSSRRYVNGQVRIRDVETGVVDVASVIEDITRAGASDPRRSTER
jgi:chemotaxis signal transduction protein